MGTFFGVITAAFRALRSNGESLVIGWSLAAVTFATGFISYTHISALVLAEHQNWKTAHLMPVVVDGQIAIGSGYFMKNAGRRRRWFGLLGFLPGLVESVVANWVSGAPHGLFAALVATVPAQAFACSSYLFERYLHEGHVPARAAAQVRRLARPVALRTSTRIAGLLAQAPEPAAPGLQEAPQGLVSPAAASVPASKAVPVFGPFMPLNGQAVPARPRRTAAPAGPKLPLPDDETELRALVLSMTRNDLYRTYQVSKYEADKLKQQYKNSEEASTRAA